MTLAVAMPTAAELVSRALEKYNPLQPRDADGQWSDGVPGFASALDKLKLSRRAPAGFVVQSSKKLKTDNADVGIAEVDGPDGPQVRVGVINSESGKWDAGFTGEARKAQLREEIGRREALMESDSDDVDDDIEDQISELESELEDLEGERTAIVSPEVMADFRRQLGEGLTVAKANKAEQDAAVKEFDALDEKRDAIIAEHSDSDLERRISRVSSELRSKLKIIKGLESGPNPRHWTPEFIAELIEMHKADVPGLEAELAPLLARRAELMPPDARARLEDLDRQYAALNEADIDGMLTSAEVSAPNGTSIRAEIWGSDDEDGGWANTRLYVLKPGETRDDADSGDDYAYFTGLRGLNKLIAGLDASRSPEAFNLSLGVRSMPLSRALESFAVMSSSPAVRLMMYARALEAYESLMRKGNLSTVIRGGKGRFARKVGSAIDAAAAVRAIVDTPKKPRAPRNAVAKALASGDSSALDGLSRESLRREAKARGIDVPRGVSEDVLKDMLWDDENSSKGDGGGAANAMADGFGGRDPETADAKRERADSLLSDMPSGQAGRDRVHTEIGGLILAADRMDAANKPSRSRAKAADTDAVADRIRALPHKPESRAALAAELDKLGAADMRAVADKWNIPLPKRTTKAQSRQAIETRLEQLIDHDSVLNGGWDGGRQPATPPAPDKPLSFFGQMKQAHADAMAADIAARAARKAAADKPKRASRTKGPTAEERRANAMAIQGGRNVWAGNQISSADWSAPAAKADADAPKRRAPARKPKASDRPDRGEQMAAISGDPDIWGKLKAAHAEDEAKRAGSGKALPPTGTSQPDPVGAQFDAEQAEKTKLLDQAEKIANQMQNGGFNRRVAANLSLDELRKFVAEGQSIVDRRGGRSGNSPVSSAVDALRPMVDNPQRGDREKTAEVLGKLTGKQLEEVAKAYGVNLLGTTVPEKRTQLTERLVGFALNSQIIRNSPWTEHADAVKSAFDPGDRKPNRRGQPEFVRREGETPDEAAARFRREYAESPAGQREAARAAMRPRVEALADRIRFMDSAEGIVAAIKADGLPSDAVRALAEEVGVGLIGSGSKADRIATLARLLATDNGKSRGGVR